MKLFTAFIILFFPAFLSAAQLPFAPEDVCPLLIGEKIPKVTLVSSQKQKVHVSQQVQIKPAVFIFYRGGWCPYCNVHLSEIVKIEKEILRLGYQIIAVSPDDVEHLQSTYAEQGLNYMLLSDSKGILIKKLGIAYQVPQNYKKTVGDASSGDNVEFLPVPSLFVVGTTGEILFEYINPNYKKRISKELLLTVLKNLDPK